MAAQEYRFVITADDRQVAGTFDNIQSRGSQAAQTISTGFQAAAAIAAAAWGKEQFGKAFEIFKGFDDESKKIKAFAGASKEQMEIIEATAKKLAPEFGKTATEVLEGMTAMKQGGATLNETIMNIGETMRLAAGVNMEMGDSADKLTDIVNMFGLQATDSGHAVDVMVSAISNGALVQGEYFEAMKKAGPVLSSYGLSLEDVSAEVLALAEGGIKGSIAATGLNNAYARLLKPTGDAVGILEKYNFTAVDSTGKTKKLADMIDELARKGLTDKEKLEIFGMYAGPALSSLLERGGDSIRKYDELLANVDGTGAKVAETMQSGVGGASRRAGADIEAGIVKAMKELEPAITGALSLTGYLDTAIDNLIGTLKTGAAGLTAAAGVLTNIGAAAEYVTDKIGITDDTTNSFAAATKTAFGSAGDLLNQAAAAYDGVEDSIIGVQAEAIGLGDKMEKSLKNISDNTGVVVSSWDELEEAVKSGALTWEQASAASVKAIDDTQRKLSDLNAQQEENEKQQAAYAKAVEAVYKASGGAAEQYFAIQEEQINEQAKTYEEMNISHVDVEKWAQAEIAKLHEKEVKTADLVVQSFSKMTGATTGASILGEAQEIENSVKAWQDAGIEIEDINRGVYEKITALMKDALDTGNANVVDQLDSIRSNYDNFSGDMSSKTAGLVSEINQELGGVDNIAFTADTSDVESKLDSVYSDLSSIDTSNATPSIKADIGDLQEKLSKAESDLASVDSEESVAKIGADADSAQRELESIKSKLSSLDGDEAEVKVTADTSDAESGIEAVSNKLSDLSEGGISFDRSSFDGLKQAIDELNQTPTLDPFGNMRKNYQQDLDKMEKMKSTYLGVINEINGAGLGYEMSDTVEKYQDEINKMMGINDGRSQEEKDAEREIKKVKEKIWKEETEARKDAYKEQLDAQKDALDEQKDALDKQLDEAEDALDRAKDMQKAYWEQQLDDAKSYYDDLEDQRDESLKMYQEQAKAEYDAAVSLLEKKKGLLQDELSAAKTHLNDLKQIYEESGAGADQYYQAQAEALAQRAQEMQDNGTDAALVEQWLTDELKDLRDEAAEAGVSGMQDVSDAIMQAYESTGKFSSATATVNDKVKELDEKLKQLKDAGSDAFFDEAAFKAQGFDQKLVDAKANIDKMQTAIDAIEGKHFDLAGQSALSLSDNVIAARERVDSLKSSLDALGEQIKAINKIDVSDKFPSSYTPSSGNNNYSGGSGGNNDGGLHFLTGPSQIKRPMYSFEGGGYTGDAPRVGGTDGRGGFLAELHGDEYVIDLKKTKKNGIMNSDSGTNITINNLTITSTKQIDGNALKAELQRLKYRG
jgi:TP901 family phage tail tape measure protein